MPSDRVQRIIDRLNWLAHEPFESRDRLFAACIARGYHVPTGEQLLTLPPTDCCFDCGTLYRDTPESIRKRDA